MSGFNEALAELGAFVEEVGLSLQQDTPTPTRLADHNKSLYKYAEALESIRREAPTEM